jgi:G:T-mismatch repair DNA endonuclease (very short patch repair protein)
MAEKSLYAAQKLTGSIGKIIVYQFHACFWHCCPKCYHDDTINNINHETMGDLHETTKARSKQIIEAGFNLIEIWECEWVKSKDYRSVKKISDHVV